MPWTESRSRDEWLAEVRRRGERIRRRRHLAVSAVGAVALLVPGYAVLSLSSVGEPDRSFQVAAGGPVTTAASGAELPSVMGSDDVAPTTTALVPSPAVPPAGPSFSTTTIEVHRRGASVESVPVRDEPVVRAAPPLTPTTAGERNGAAQGTLSGAANSAGAAPPASTAVPTTAASPPPCPASEVRVTVTLEKSAYAPGETVRWSSTLENRSASTCLVSGRAFFHVENGSGTTVGSFPYTANYMLPVPAEPGKTITNTGSWDQRDCSASPCVQVPAGPYVVVAEWTEGGPYVGRGSFQISA